MYGAWVVWWIMSLARVEYDEPKFQMNNIGRMVLNVKMNSARCKQSLIGRVQRSVQIQWRSIAYQKMELLIWTVCCKLIIYEESIANNQNDVCIKRNVKKSYKI